MRVRTVVLLGRIGQGGDDLGGGDFAPGIDHVHDLALAAAELVFGWHGLLFLLEG